jgi:thiazole synthase
MSGPGGAVIETNTLSVTVNGDLRRVSTGVSIAAMLREIGVDPKRVAVERNLAIVPKSTLEDVAVEDGDQFEIVHFVGGG